jgi:signal transduction histidine kinase
MELERNRDHDLEDVKVILTALQESMRAVQLALSQPSGFSSDQLRARLVDWRGSLSRLAQELSVEQTDQLTTLYEISQAINSSLDLDETLNAVMDSLIHLTGAERGCLMLLDEDGGLSTQIARDFGERSELELSRSVVREAIEQGEPVLTTNAQVDPRFSAQDSVIGYHLRSIVCVPLKVRRQVTGALYLDNRVKEGAFSESDMALLTAFANQAAAAIENARLYTMTDQALEARLEELTTMQRIDRDLNASLDFQRVLELTLSWAVRATGADAGALSLVEAGEDRVMASIGDALRPGRLEPDVLQVVLRSQEPVAIGSRRILVPIRCEDRTLGLLDLRRNGEGAFSTDHTGFASRLADHAAIAIENARLYQQVRQANQAKSEFVSIVAHELRTPMTAIRGYADMLTRGLMGPLTDQQMRPVRTIRRNVERMQLLVSDLQDISRIEARQLRLELEPTAIDDVLEGALEAVKGRIEKRAHELVVEVPSDLPKVQADPSRLAQILINLLSNACKYTSDGGEIQVRAWSDGACVHCAISDTGIGISQEDQKRLFTKFFRADGPEVRDRAGTGLGLCITKNLVELHEGEIEVESQLGEGTTFTFTIPTAEHSSL